MLSFVATWERWGTEPFPGTVTTCIRPSCCLTPAASLDKKPPLAPWSTSWVRFKSSALWTVFISLLSPILSEFQAKQSASTYRRDLHFGERNLLLTPLRALCMSVHAGTFTPPEDTLWGWDDPVIRALVWTCWSWNVTWSISTHLHGSFSPSMPHLKSLEATTHRAALWAEGRGGTRRTANMMLGGCVSTQQTEWDLQFRNLIPTRI